MREEIASARIIRASFHADGGGPGYDDRVVLRIAREPLRNDPPEVRFIGRSVARGDQGALPWPGYDSR